MITSVLPFDKFVSCYFCVTVSEMCASVNSKIIIFVLLFQKIELLLL